MSTARRPARRSPWLLAVLLLAAAHMLVFDRGLGGDGWAGFALLESLADDGDLWLENNHRGVMNGLVGTSSGHLTAQYPPGTAVLDALPFFAGRALDRLLPVAGPLARGLDMPPVGRVPRGVFLSVALIVLARNAAALLGLAWTAGALLRLGASERTAAAATALTFFGGPLLFYSLVGMTHAPTFALAALLFYRLAGRTEEAGWSYDFVSGLVAGAAVLVRYSAVALLLPALLAPLLAPLLERPRRIAGVAATAAGFALLALPLPFWWRALFGSWLPPPYGGRWMVTLASPWNVLFAPVHGLFLFHPALLCAAAGLAALAGRELARRAVGPGTIAAAWFLAVAVPHGWWSEWANAGAYGQRFLIDALPALALGFAAWLAPGRGRRLRAGTAVAATLAGWLLFFTAVGGLVPPPAGLPWPQRLGDYAVLLQRPPGAAELGRALARASFLWRALAR